MTRLRHLAIRCHDMERSRRFYEEVIGWKFIGYRPGGGGLDLSDGVNNITLVRYGGGPRPRVEAAAARLGGHLFQGKRQGAQRYRSRR
jgi:catechol 2,3-dioxygenase-like lactoylglutathione lyase family enzyme